MAKKNVEEEVVEEGQGKTNGFILGRIEYWRTKDRQEGTTHQVWKFRRGPNNYDYEVHKI